MKRLLPLLALATALHAAPPEVKQTIKTLPAQMKYDTEKFAVPPGAKVIVTFENHDEMPHNVVFCLPAANGADDKGLEVAQAGWTLGDKALEKGWIPDHPRVLAHSKLLDPHKTEVITFTAPEKPGVYPFVCTVPGHAMIMNGTMRVQLEPKPIVGLHYRYFEGDFKEWPNFSKLTPLTSGPLPSGKLDPQADPATAKRKQMYALEFEGVIEAPDAGEYEFSLASDDGSELLIDKKGVIDNKKSKIANKLQTKKVKLTKGEHAILVRYYQGTGGRTLSLTWSGPGFETAALSTQNLTGKLIEDEKAKYTGLPLTPAGEPIICRNFITGASARGIGIGFPGSVNVNWDANSMTVAEVWQGAFIDAKRHWTDRGVGFQPPSGFGLVRPVAAPLKPLFNPEGDDAGTPAPAGSGPGQPIATLAGAEAPWPEEDSRAAGYRFHGYTLSAKREPIFRYETPTADVTDALEAATDASGPKLKRIVTITPRKGAKAGPLYFRAAAAAKDLTLDSNRAQFGKDVQLTIDGATPKLRTIGNLSEVIVPLDPANTSTTLTLTYAWAAAHQHH